MVNIAGSTGSRKRAGSRDERTFIGVTFDITAVPRLFDPPELGIREINQRAKNFFRYQRHHHDRSASGGRYLVLGYQIATP